MKKMNFGKRIATLVLAVMMAIPVASVANLPAASTVEAASTKNVAMYVGEKVEIGSAKYVKGLKTSKKKIVKSGTYTTYGTKYAYIEAKKKGKSTVSFKKYGNTYKYNITVKKANISATAYDAGYGEFAVKVDNKTNQYFENVELTYTVRDLAGAVIAQDTVMGYDLAAKGTCYKSIYTGITSSQWRAGVTCTVKATPFFHDFTSKYVNVSNKITVTKEEVDPSTGKVTITYKNNNKKSSRTSGSMFVVFYDANGTICDTAYNSLYIKKNQTESYTAYSSNDYASYKIFVNAYYEK